MSLSLSPRRGLPGLLAALLLLLAACAPAAAPPPIPGAETSAAAPINVVTTVGMIADVVNEVGGDRVAITQLMGAGVDPHLYTATQSDVSTIMEADIIFYGGLNLEARLADIFEQIGQEKPAVAVGDALPKDKILTERGTDAPDPHVWMEVDLWALVTEIIRDALIQYDPDGAEVYRTNTQTYLAQLAELDRYIRDQISRVPREQRVLVTAHDAFQYFSRAYDIEVFAPQGITTAAEAGVEDIRRTVEVLVTRNVPAIFVETSVPPDVVEAIVAGAAAQGHTVAIGGQLYSDAMGAPGTPEGTYIGMLRHNVDTIVAGLMGLSE